MSTVVNAGTRAGRAHSSQTEGQAERARGGFREAWRGEAEPLPPGYELMRGKLHRRP